MNGKIAGFGEVMIRLAPAGKQRLEQVLPGQLEATFGGGEANVCASIAHFGGAAKYLTVLPDNKLAKAFAAEQRGFGTDVSGIRYVKGTRMGIYFIEHGAAQRGSEVIYDREYSAIALAAPEDYDFDAMLDGCTHLHVSGITPALSKNAYLSTLAMVKAASAKGIRISCDLNYRKKLWNWEPGTSKTDLAGRCMKEIVAYADIIIGNEEDASDVFGIKAGNTSVESGKLDIARYPDVARKLAAAFPKASFVATTLRESISADCNKWGGMLYERKSDTAFFAPLDENGNYLPYTIGSIVDRFGGGDSFCAGLIYALSSDDMKDPATAIRFAVAASCLKHSIPGDYNRVSVDEVLSLMKGGGTGRVKR